MLRAVPAPGVASGDPGVDKTVPLGLAGGLSSDGVSRVRAGLLGVAVGPIDWCSR